MEYIINRFIRIFYILMIFVMLWLVFYFHIIISILSAINLFMFIFLLYGNITKQYVRYKNLLKIELILNIILVCFVITEKRVFTTTFDYIMYALAIILVNGTIYFRILIVNRLIKIANRGEVKWIN